MNIKVESYSLLEESKIWDEIVGSRDRRTIYFSEYFNYYQEKTNFLVFYESNDVLALLPYSMSDQSAISHPKTFSAGLTWVKEPELRTIEATYESLVLYFKNRSLSLETKLAPLYINLYSSLERNVMLSAGFKSVKPRICHVIDLESSLKLSSRRLRAIKNAEKLSLKIIWLTSEAEIIQLMNLLSEKYSEFGIKISVDAKRALNLYNLVKSNIFFPVVCNSFGEFVAGGFGYGDGDCLRMPIYSSFIRTNGITEKILLGAVSKAKELGFRYLDLGTSTDPKTNESRDGIVMFKEEMGAVASIVETYKII